MKVIGLAGWSGAGKTTLLTRLIPHFVAEGLRVSTIKHAHHNFDVDVPGKDSVGASAIRSYGGSGLLRAALGIDARAPRRARAGVARPSRANVFSRSGCG